MTPGILEDIFFDFWSFNGPENYSSIHVDFHIICGRERSQIQPSNVTTETGARYWATAWDYFTCSLFVSLFPSYIISYTSHSIFYMTFYSCNAYLCIFILDFSFSKSIFSILVFSFLKKSFFAGLINEPSFPRHFTNRLLFGNQSKQVSQGKPSHQPVDQSSSSPNLHILWIFPRYKSF